MPLTHLKQLVKLLEDEGGSSDNIAAMMLHSNSSIRQLAVRTVFKCRLLDVRDSVSGGYLGQVQLTARLSHPAQ